MTKNLVKQFIEKNILRLYEDSDSIDQFLTCCRKKPSLTVYLCNWGKTTGWFSDQRLFPNSWKFLLLKINHFLWSSGCLVSIRMTLKITTSKNICSQKCFLIKTKVCDDFSQKNQQVLNRNKLTHNRYILRNFGIIDSIDSIMYLIQSFNS